MVDTRDLKSLAGNRVPVRVRSPAPEKGKSEQDFPFSGAAPAARVDPLRSNAKEDSRPLSRSSHADMKVGSDLDCSGAPRRRKLRIACGDFFMPRIRKSPRAHSAAPPFQNQTRVVAPGLVDNFGPALRWALILLPGFVRQLSASLNMMGGGSKPPQPSPKAGKRVICALCSVCHSEE